jgi:ABC-type uncharacterized transport system substrate-binding protein
MDPARLPHAPHSPRPADSLREDAVMNRRTFLAGTGAVLLAAPLAAEAQGGKIPRIGYLGWAPPTTTPASQGDIKDAFLKGLRERGYVEGQSIAIEYRFGTMDQLADLAAELVRLRVDAILAVATPAARAAKQATSTIPIVMVVVGDPVGGGLVASLGRPGGNVTGPSWLSSEVFPKALELLKEAVPRVSRVAMLMDPTNAAQLASKNDLDVAARGLRLTLQRIDVRTGADLDGAFAAALRQRADAFYRLPLLIAPADSQRILEFAVKNRMPTLVFSKESVEAGGLMSYGPNLRDHSRHAAYYIDKILKGAKPADLPVEQPTKFELVINLKTAKALGFTIPPSVLGRADEVIQ